MGSTDLEVTFSVAYGTDIVSSSCLKMSPLYNRTCHNSGLNLLARVLYVTFLFQESTKIVILLGYDILCFNILDCNKRATTAFISRNSSRYQSSALTVMSMRRSSNPEKDSRLKANETDEKKMRQCE